MSATGKPGGEELSGVEKGPVCSGYCAPLYIFGGIAGVGLLIKFIYDRKSTIPGRLLGLLKGLALSATFGLLVFMLCRMCYRQAAYTSLVVPSLWFGVTMFVLLLQNRAADRRLIASSTPSPNPSIK